MTVVEEMRFTLEKFCADRMDADCTKCPFRYVKCDFSKFNYEELDAYMAVMNKYLEENKMKETNKTNRYIYVNLPLKSGTKNYLFSVSEDAEVAYGDTLIVQTYNGHELEGTAVSNPVTLDSTFLAIMKQELGIKGEIQPVVGKRTVVRF